MTRRTVLRLLGASTAFGLLAACTASAAKRVLLQPPSRTPPGQPPRQRRSSGAAAGAQPKNGGRLSLDVAFDINKFDPTKNFRRVGYHTAHAYGHLMRFKSGPDVKYTDLILEPDHAESWSMSPDGTTFTFNIRKGVKYHNVPPVNGREVTAKDVKFSLEYISHLQRQFASKEVFLQPQTEAGCCRASRASRRRMTTRPSSSLRPPTRRSSTTPPPRSCRSCHVKCSIETVISRRKPSAAVRSTSTSPPVNPAPVWCGKSIRTTGKPASRISTRSTSWCCQSPAPPTLRSRASSST